MSDASVAPSTPPAPAAAPAALDPTELLRSRSYVQLLVLAALIGIPISAVAYFYLALVSKLQHWVFTSLPTGLGFHGTPVWWPVLPLVLAGVLVSATINYLPGTSGHEPSEGFKAGGGSPTGIELPGVILASLATLALGVVLGPEAPLIAIGVVATLLGTAIRLGSLAAQTLVLRHRLVWTPVAGLAVAGVTIAFVEITGKGSQNVLFSGQSALPTLVLHASTWTVGALIVLGVAKSIAYAVSLSAFRGGPIFPAMFIGGVIGVAGSHLPGLSLVPAVAMGIGAMTTVMLRLPLTATLLAVLLFASDGLSVTPLVIVAVVVAYVLTARMPQKPADLTCHRRTDGAAPPAGAGDAPAPAAGA